MSSFILGPESYSPDWYAIRTFDPRRKPCVVFGASEAAAVCGLSHYETPLHIYLRKRGEIPEVEETDAMRMGKLLEPIVLGEYERRTGYNLRPEPRMLLHAEHQHIGATLDSWVRADLSVWVVDAKTTTFRRAEEFGDDFTDEIPDDFLMQLQQQMLVAGVEFADLAVLLDGRTLRVYRVAANAELQELIVECTSALLELILAGNPPDPTYHHRSTNDLLKAIYGIDKDREVILSEQAAECWGGYETLGQQIKELQSQREECQNVVLHSLGEAGVGLLPDGSSLARVLVNVKARSQDAYSYTRITKRKPKVKE